MHFLQTKQIINNVFILNLTFWKFFFDPFYHKIFIFCSQSETYMIQIKLKVKFIECKIFVFNIVIEFSRMHVQQYFYIANVAFITNYH